MKIKNHYETFWKSKKGLESFLGYERNRVLPSLFPRTGKVLDLACGDGAVAQYLKNNLGLDVVGFDVSEIALKESKKRGIKVVLGDVEKKLPFDNKSFDVVFWGDNIEHLFDPGAVVVEIARILKSGGTLILSCPNMGYWKYRLYYLFKGRLPDTEWTGNPPWAWSHIRFFNKSLILELLNINNFKVNKFIGINRLFPDKYLTVYKPGLFGMIIVIQASKP